MSTTTAAERNFSTFELGDDVYQLADGLVPEIADRLKVKIGEQPSSEALHKLVGAVGTNKVLRENGEVQGIDLTTAADLVERSGVDRQLNRSLWTPNQRVRLAGETFEEHHVPTAFVATGGVANWQDRNVPIASKLDRHDMRIFYPVGNRKMESETEELNPGVIAIKRVYGQYPTEAQYAANVVQTNFVKAGYDVLVMPHDTKSGDEIAKRLFEQSPQLLDEQITAGRAAVAGVQFAGQLRRAARFVDPQFDSDPSNPQLFVVTDKLPIARTPEEVADPVHFQSPFSALRQAVVAAKTIHDATGGK